MKESKNIITSLNDLLNFRMIESKKFVLYFNPKVLVREWDGDISGNPACERLELENN